MRWAANVLAFEIGLFYYALFSWRTPLPDASKHVAFSYHKKNGYGTVLAGILVVMLIEMIALHTLLWLRNPGMAWVVTALSLYGIMWFLGDWRAVCLRPILVEKDALIVRIGLRWTMQVPFGAIAWVRPVQAKPPSRKTPGYLNAILLGTPQYLIAFKKPIVAHGLYGMRRTITTLGLAVDDPASFETALERRFADWKHEED